MLGAVRGCSGPIAAVRPSLFELRTRGEGKHIKEQVPKTQAPRNRPTRKMRLKAWTMGREFPERQCAQSPQGPNDRRSSQTCRSPGSPVSSEARRYQDSQSSCPEEPTEHGGSGGQMHQGLIAMGECGGILILSRGSASDEPSLMSTCFFSLPSLCLPTPRPCIYVVGSDLLTASSVSPARSGICLGLRRGVPTTQKEGNGRSV